MYKTGIKTRELEHVPNIQVRHHDKKHTIYETDCIMEDMREPKRHITDI